MFHAISPPRTNRLSFSLSRSIASDGAKFEAKEQLGDERNELGPSARAPTLRTKTIYRSGTTAAKREGIMSPSLPWQLVYDFGDICINEGKGFMFLKTLTVERQSELVLLGP